MNISAAICNHRIETIATLNGSRRTKSRDSAKIGTMAASPTPLGRPANFPSRDGDTLMPANSNKIAGRNLLAREVIRRFQSN